MRKRQIEVTSNITFVHSERKDKTKVKGWCWSVYLNGEQYASEVLPEKSSRKARRAVAKWTKRALNEKSRFYFPKVKK
jgi:hypothetical protein